MSHDISIVKESYSFLNVFLASFPFKLHLTLVKSDVWFKKRFNLSDLKCVGEMHKTYS